MKAQEEEARRPEEELMKVVGLDGCAILLFNQDLNQAPSCPPLMPCLPTPPTHALPPLALRF